MKSLDRLTFIVLVIMISCTPKTEQKPEEVMEGKSPGTVTVSPFGMMPDGTAISLYTLVNNRGITMQVINYGGIIVSLMVPDKSGKHEDVVMGYDSLSHYLQDNPYFGALIGRYGNRIAKGKFSLDGKEYTLTVNNGPNHLHGGKRGFDKVVWDVKQQPSEDGVSLKLTYNSPDQEQGYPGNLKAEVTYTLTNNNELRLDYKATTDQKTIVNLTQHTYFNLSAGKSDILSHQLLLDADQFLPVDKTLIPTGEFRNVANTPFDFRTAKTIGSRINETDEQLTIGKGYDHCWVLNTAKDGLNHAATLYDSISGREVTIYTSEPGVQFYSGNFLDGSNTGKKGKVYNFRDGLCLETEHFPDSPNRKEFPSVVLEPGSTYTSQTVYKFSVR